MSVFLYLLCLAGAAASQAIDCTWGAILLWIAAAITFAWPEIKLSVRKLRGIQRHYRRAQIN